MVSVTSWVSDVLPGFEKTTLTDWWASDGPADATLIRRRCAHLHEGRCCISTATWTISFRHTSQTSITMQACTFTPSTSGAMAVRCVNNSR